MTYNLSSYNSRQRYYHKNKKYADFKPKHLPSEEYVLFMLKRGFPMKCIESNIRTEEEVA